ncbi:aldehyde dehydrogenase family protein [Albidovulum sp.]|uniref:aldehyde dehydrogenase family protein n=1 Tax=Albidovulum sp. TaxID=1872424 RepID=UPI0039B9BB00
MGRLTVGRDVHREILGVAVPTDLPRHMYIGGRRVDAANGDRIATVDPATGQAFADVPSATIADVDAAVDNSRRALRGPWRDTLPVERGRILNRVARLIRRDAERLAIIETLDSGKPLAEARGDVATAAGYFEYYAGIADKMQGDSIPLGTDYMSFTVHEPVGVTAHVIPWNFPLVTTARGVAPALAAGNTAVVKPASQTPLTALALAELLTEAGLPAGVYNALSGRGGVIGDALCGHAGVDHVTFTGSVPTGINVMKVAAERVTSVTLELGGKSPVVVLADADLDAAVEGTLKAIYMNAGQVCSAGSRLVIERKVHAPMLERLVARARQLSVGHGLGDPKLGPLISDTHRRAVASYVDGARTRGISVATGGEPVEVAGFEGGYFYAPTILDAVHARDPVVQEEIFGPVLAVQVVESAEEAIEVCNGTPFGLCAGIYTRDLSRAMRFARDVDAGQIFINQYFAGGIQTPFGGTKLSGFGREKGLAALAAYYQVKCITARI